MNEMAGIISIVILVSIQIVYFAFAFGKISQDVSSINRRLNDLSHRFDEVENRVGRLEGRR